MEVEFQVMFKRPHTHHPRRVPTATVAVARTLVPTAYVLAFTIYRLREVTSFDLVQAVQWLANRETQMSRDHIQHAIDRGRSLPLTPWSRDLRTS